MSLSLLPSVLSPLLSIFILMSGIGLFDTFIPIQLASEGVSPFNIGLIISSYYIGMTLGAFKNAHFILRVGHIRAYATFASLASVVMLCQGFHYSLWLWIICRIINGYCFAGLYITIESWILGCSTAMTRGRLLAFYMVVYYSASALGQFFLNVATLENVTPFTISAALATLSVIPLAITKTHHPTIEEPSALTIFSLYKLSPSGIVSCTMSGLLLGAILGLLPLYTQSIFKDVSTTAFIMFLLIFGGTTLQYPIGRLSDAFDRRKMLIILCVVISTLSIYIAFSAGQLSIIFYCSIFLFGGVSFALYPVSVSHTCDILEHKDIVSATQGLMLSYGVGAITGPTLASTFMSLWGNIGLFGYFISISLILMAYLISRVLIQSHLRREEHSPFVTLPMTTPVVSELDPRADEEAL